MTFLLSPDLTAQPSGEPDDRIHQAAPYEAELKTQWTLLSHMLTRLLLEGAPAQTATATVLIIMPQHAHSSSGVRHARTRHQVLFFLA